jgi:hypothetical protein
VTNFEIGYYTFMKMAAGRAERAHDVASQGVEMLQDADIEDLIRRQAAAGEDASRYVTQSREIRDSMLADPTWAPTHGIPDAPWFHEPSEAFRRTGDYVEAQRGAGQAMGLEEALGQHIPQMQQAQAAQRHLQDQARQAQAAAHASHGAAQQAQSTGNLKGLGGLAAGGLGTAALMSRGE